MTKINHIDPKNSKILFGLNKEINFFINLYNRDKFPKTIMLSGNKGIGKFTLINHLLCYIYDKKNYNLDKKEINKDSTYYMNYLNGTFSDVIYLSGDHFKNVKIEDIRILKSTILKSSFSELKRFIILDDVELFNLNSLNALLKLVEEPVSNNYFILINNQTKPLLETVCSRAIEFKIFLEDSNRIKIIETLLNYNNINPFISYEIGNLSPGSYLSFNCICEENDIKLDTNYQKNLEILINLYKKNKDKNVINLIMFITDFYFNKLSKDKNKHLDKVIDDRSFVVSNINKFLLYNINQNALLNAINYRLSNE